MAVAAKYYPYGYCRNSTGEIGTDKLFTGQRLDDTGLYYYGARYYDPTIGRFISADTIVQNPAKSQAWNRYSYGLNNPLKYIDPSGHIVKFVERTGLLTNLTVWRSDELERAWNRFAAVAPDVAKAMELSKTTYTIKGEQSKSYSKGTTMYINVSSASPDLMAIDIAHESVHVRTPRKSSLFEETRACQYQSYIASKLGYKYDSSGIYGQLEDINLVLPSSKVGDAIKAVRELFEDPTQVGDWQAKKYAQQPDIQENEPLLPFAEFEGGFKLWGFDNGAAIISQNDPRTYSWEDWYGY